MSHETILIIEDDNNVRNLLEMSLSRIADYHVIKAADGREGLDRALHDTPSVILLDLALPYLDGLEIMERLAEQNHTIPTIIITADSRTEIILQAFRLGAKDFLQKPFKIKEVRAALENALTEERLRRERDKLTRALAQANRRQQQQLENWIALNYIAKTIISTLEESEVLRRVVATVNHILNVEAGSLLLFDGEEDSLHFVVTLGNKTTPVPKQTVAVNQGITGWVAKHAKPLLIPDVRKDARFDPNVDQLPGFRTRSVACVPLKSKNQVLGVFEVINKQGRSGTTVFTSEDIKMLQTLASWITVAVENARLTRSLQEHAAAQTLKQAVITMAHHINNLLMSLSLELNSVEHAELTDAEKNKALIRTSQKYNRQIAAVVKAMDQLTDVHTTSYIGSEEMIDIEDLLADSHNY